MKRDIMRPKVSVIVPVYKAEAYLHRCVDSLLAQTFHDFEILLINDGSPDKSGEICDEYQLKDPRVRVIHKENGGVSSARQCGIDNALGEYTIHADPDDWVESSMLKELYDKAKEENADMVICDYIEEYKNRRIYHKQQPTSLDHDTVLKELFLQLHGSCCNKLIRLSCYRKFRVKFPLELSCNEDQYVCASFLIHPLKISYISKAFYHYRQDANINSLVKKPKTYEERSIVKNMFCTLMKNHKYYNICNQFMITDLVSNVFYNKLYSSFEFKKRMYDYRNIILKNSNVSWHLRIRLYLSCIGFYSQILFLQNLFTKIRIWQKLAL